MKFLTSLIIITIVLMSTNAIAMSFNTKIADYERTFVIEDKETADVKANVNFVYDDFNFSDYISQINSNDYSNRFLKYLRLSSVVVCVKSNLQQYDELDKIHTSTKSCYLTTINTIQGKIIAIVPFSEAAPIDVSDFKYNVVNYKGTMEELINRVYAINSLNSALELIKDADCEDALKEKAVQAAIKAYMGDPIQTAEEERN